jgi:hypothetical protein
MDQDKPNRYTAVTDTVKILELLDRKRTAVDVATTPPVSDAANGNGNGHGSGPEASSNHKPARSLAPGSLAAKARDDDIIKLTQDPAGDPNMLLLVARTEDELKQKNKGLPGEFIRGRKKALEGYLNDLKEGKLDVDNEERLEKFYTEKLGGMK